MSCSSLLPIWNNRPSSSTWLTPTHPSFRSNLEDIPDLLPPPHYLFKYLFFCFLDHPIMVINWIHGNSCFISVLAEPEFMSLMHSEAKQTEISESPYLRGRPRSESWKSLMIWGQGQATKYVTFFWLAGDEVTKVVFQESQSSTFRFQPVWVPPVCV